VTVFGRKPPLGTVSVRLLTAHTLTIWAMWEVVGTDETLISYVHGIGGLSGVNGSKTTLNK